MTIAELIVQFVLVGFLAPIAFRVGVDIGHLYDAVVGAPER